MMRASWIAVLVVAACGNTADPAADMLPNTYGLPSAYPPPFIRAARCETAARERDCFLSLDDRVRERGRLTSAAVFARPMFAAEVESRRLELERAARRDPAFFERMGYKPTAADWLVARGSVARILAERFRTDLERLSADVLALTDAQLVLAAHVLETIEPMAMVDRVLRGDLSFVAPMGRDGGPTRPVKVPP